jgi:hypothetical protein
VNFLPEIITLSKEVSILLNIHVFCVALMGNMFQKVRGLAEGVCICCDIFQNHVFLSTFPEAGSPAINSRKNETCRVCIKQIKIVWIPCFILLPDHGS